MDVTWHGNQFHPALGRAQAFHGANLEAISTLTAKARLLKNVPRSTNKRSATVSMNKHAKNILRPRRLGVGSLLLQRNQTSLNPRRSRDSILRRGKVWSGRDSPSRGGVQNYNEPQVKLVVVRSRPSCPPSLANRVLRRTEIWKNAGLNPP